MMMDSDNLENFEKTYSIIESECMNFERKYRELLYELGRKRHLLDETREMLNDATRKQHELEVKLETEKREKENKIKDLNLFKNVAREFEEFRNGNKDGNFHKIELEIIRKENDSFKNQVHELQQENIKLKRELEDMHGKHNCLQAFQKDIEEQQSNIKNCISQYVKSRRFTNEIEEKMRKFEESYNICSKLEVYLELANKKTKEAQEKVEVLEHEIVRLRAELFMTKELIETRPPSIQDFNEDLDYWKHIAQERKDQLEIELKNLTILTEELQVRTTSTSKSVQNEIEQFDKIKKLQDTIDEVLIENEKLKIQKEMVDVDVQTENVEEQPLDRTVENDKVILEKAGDLNTDVKENVVENTEAVPDKPVLSEVLK